MLTYRLATPEDSPLYFDWANDPDTRRQSFNSDPISLETHECWFSRKLADANALLLMFSNEAGTPVGQVRFERTSGEVIIGVSVDTHFRGRGLASELIRQGCVACREQWGDVLIHAYIKADNQASIRSFEKAGFTFSHKVDQLSIQSLVYYYSTK
ncbi:hypothetical protein GCM10027341_04720 [Spirosoma knui]